MTAADVEALEMRLLLEAIAARYGYDFLGYSPESMRRRLQLALSRSGAQNFGELQHRVLSSPTEFALLLDELTVRVSGMFRDPGFFLALREQVMPHLRTYPLLKVWHCGCATGEEVYSTAIVLNEAGLYERSQLYATDLSDRALGQARQATYSDERLDAFEAAYAQSGGRHALSDYFTRAYGGIAFHDSLKRHVLFFQHNLQSDHPFGEMNVVFCRNVLLYFGAVLRRRVLATLKASLCPGGFLCLGSSERLSRSETNDGFTEFNVNQRIYRYQP